LKKKKVKEYGTVLHSLEEKNLFRFSELMS